MAGFPASEGTHDIPVEPERITPRIHAVMARPARGMPKGIPSPTGFVTDSSLPLRQQNTLTNAENE